MMLIPHLGLNVRGTRVAAKGCEVAQRLALLLQAHDRVLLEHPGRLLLAPHPLSPHGLKQRGVIFGKDMVMMMMRAMLR